jgi:hypothetical protein
VNVPPDAQTFPNDDAALEQRARARRVRRAIEHLVVLVLVGTGAAVSVSSWPILERIAEGSPPPAARRGIERVTRARGWAVGPPTQRLEGPFGKRAPTTAGRIGAPEPNAADLFEELMRENDDDVPPDAFFDRADGKRALARTALRLLDRADEDGEAVFLVPPGEPLVVVRDLGGWLLLAHRDEDDGRVQSGWARRNEVAILP